MHICECGRPATSVPKNLTANSSRSARNKNPRYLKGHDLCERCAANLEASFQATRKKEKEAAWREKHRLKYEVVNEN